MRFATILSSRKPIICRMAAIRRSTFRPFRAGTLRKRPHRPREGIMSSKSGHDVCWLNQWQFAFGGSPKRKHSMKPPCLPRRADQGGFWARQLAVQSPCVSHRKGLRGIDSLAKRRSVGKRDIGPDCLRLEFCALPNNGHNSTTAPLGVRHGPKRRRRPAVDHYARDCAQCRYFDRCILETFWNPDQEVPLRYSRGN